MRLVLTLILVAAVGEFDEQRLCRAGQQFAVEYADNFVAFLPGLHSGEADTSALASAVTQHPSRDDSSVLVKHVVQVLFGNVGRQVGQVEIGRVLLLLLFSCWWQVLKQRVRMKENLWIKRENIERWWLGRWTRRRRLDSIL